MTTAQSRIIAHGSNPAVRHPGNRTRRRSPGRRPVDPACVLAWTVVVATAGAWAWALCHLGRLALRALGG